MLLFGLAGLYALIGITIFTIDAWFRWSDEFDYRDDFVWFCVFWPVLMPVILLSDLKDKIKEARKSYDKKQEEQRRIRVQVEKEVATQLAALEEEMISDSSKRAVRR